MNSIVDSGSLSEKDIEDWLYANPALIPPELYRDRRRIIRWIGRQYRLPSGIADLIGLTENGDIVVVEIKKVPITKLAILQVARYALDIHKMLEVTDGLAHPWPKVHRLLIGPNIDNETLNEAHGCDVRVVRFEAQLHLLMGNYCGDLETNEYDRMEQIGRRPEWSFLIKEVGDIKEAWDKWEESEEARRKEFGKFNPYLNTPDEYDKLMDAISSEEEANDDDEAVL